MYILVIQSLYSNRQEQTSLGLPHWVDVSEEYGQFGPMLPTLCRHADSASVVSGEELCPC